MTEQIREGLDGQSTPENETRPMPLVQEFKKAPWQSLSPGDQQKRRIPTQMEREKMDRALVALGNLMHDTSAWWQLDGALNVSLTKGDYLGVHADIDVSLLREDIPQLEKYLVEHGYGLFLYKRDDQPDEKMRTYRRVGAQAFTRTGDWQSQEPWHLRIAAIDENGGIRQDADLPVVDIAVIERGEQGQLLGWRNVALPKKWLEGETIEFKSVPIHLSNPARFVFNKIFFARPYDENDLKEYAATGALSTTDVDDIETATNEIFRQFAQENLESGVMPEDIIAKNTKMVHVKEMIGKLREWIVRERS